MSQAPLPLAHTLPAGEACVWYTWPERITDPAALRRYEAILSAAELARCRRFKFEKDQQLYLVAHALVRTVLSRYATVDPHDWEFIEGSHGKPDISFPQFETPLRFNLSHCDGCAACIVTSDTNVGVDVEHPARKVEVLGLSRRFFSALEADELARLPAAAQQDRFFDYWTLKEAYVKAQGQGLTIPLADFSFHLGQPLRISFAPALVDHPQHWQFQQLLLDSGHKLGIAIHRPNRPDLQITAQHLTP